MTLKLNKKIIVRSALCAVLVSALGYSFVAKSETKLIPFQGKLTDASGQVISDGAIVVQFKMYDAPVGGQAKWNGEVQMLSVNGGLVNTTLGTKASLKNVDFSSPTYLEITIDANGDNQIGPEDPPLLPRQSIIPAVYAVQAGDAKTLSGYDWSAIFGTNDPTGKIPGNKLADKEITAAQIKDKTITAQQVADSTITGAKIAKGTITSTQLANSAMGTGQIADGAITTAKVAGKSITTELMANREMVDAYETAAPIGSIAKSKNINTAVNADHYHITGADILNPGFSNTNYSNYIQIPGMSVKLKTSGRPVMIMLQRGHIDVCGYVVFQLKRDDRFIDWTGHGFRSTGDHRPSIGYTSVTSSIITFIDNPPEGEHQYSLYIGNSPNKADSLNWWGDPYLIAFEL